MKLQSLSAFILLACGWVMPSFATTFPTPTTPFSQYGQIQNVQNYSSNPFWNPNSPYNQRMPVPIYVNGVDVDTSDCTAIVGALVSSFCSQRNNCIGMDVSDARPTITIQLASLPNHNYVTPCAGYIDSEFEKYKSQNAVAVPKGKSVAFPTATTPNTNANQQNYEFQPQTQQLPDWQNDMIERQNELQNLQAATGTTNSELAQADFPKTADNLTFEQSVQLGAAGYAPYKDVSGYHTINIAMDNQQLQASGTFSQNSAVAQNKCANAKTMMATLNADLKKLTECQESKKKFSECYPELKGDYPTTQFSPSILSGEPIEQNQGYSRSGSRNRWWSFILTPGVWTSLSASDCLTDPVTGQRTCCNTVFESKDRKVNIGGYMFCGAEIKDANGKITETVPIYGMARQCLQNNRKRNTTAAGAIGGTFQNDFWNQECTTRYCQGYQAPTPGIESALIWTPDETNICWKWECPTGYRKIENTCISDTETTEYETLKQSIIDMRAQLSSECANFIQ